MDGQRLHADLRGPAADRRRARRPVRAATAVRDRPGDLHRRVRGRRAGSLEQRAHRGACRPGPRRRDRDPADPDHPLGRRVAATAGAGPRGLGRHRRPGHRRGSARGRGHRAGRELALDLLAQRAGRHRRRGTGLPPTPASRAGPRAGSTCPDWPWPAAACSGWSGPSSTATTTAGPIRGSSAPSPSAPSCSSCSASGSAEPATRCCRSTCSAAAPSRPPTPCRC